MVRRRQPLQRPGRHLVRGRVAAERLHPHAGELRRLEAEDRRDDRDRPSALARRDADLPGSAGRCRGAYFAAAGAGRAADLVHHRRQPRVVRTLRQARRERADASARTDHRGTRRQDHRLPQGVESRWPQGRRADLAHAAHLRRRRRRGSEGARARANEGVPLDQHLAHQGLRRRLPHLQEGEGRQGARTRLPEPLGRGDGRAPRLLL